MSPVQDLAFYNAGCDKPRGLRRAVVPVRRLLRRLLRPIFIRQVELFQHLITRLDADETSLRGACEDIERLSKRQDELDDRVETVLAFGWDYVAMVRRLAILEDQVAALTGHNTPTADEADLQPSILFPSLDANREARSKVC
jgi:hypothetical protein